MKATTNQQISIDEKLATLRAVLKEMSQVVIAYSGGVDSTFLLKVAVDTLGSKAIGLTAISPSYPEWELVEALRPGAWYGCENT